MSSAKPFETSVVSKYLNPLTDYGFKRIFGNESYKELLIDFLNELIQDQGTIVDLSYLNSEQLGNGETERRVVFDIYCKTDCDNYFIVEMQKVQQAFFKDRSIYYSTFPIQSQAIKGKWDFRLNPVFTVAIVDFILFDEEEYYHNVKLIEEKTGKVFYDKLVYKYLELPKFTKSLDELETNFERWIYLLKKLPTFENRPPELKGKVFDKLFRVAEIAQLTPKEMEKYNKSIEEYADVKSAMEFAKEKGMKIGEEKGGELQKIEIAKRCLQENLPVDLIIKLTGLTIEQLNTLK